MYEELCWINTFLDDGTYVPNTGMRYFAEAVNPIPRSLWRNKPEIGIDYAIARGQGGGSSSQGGVHATISTGMIGQGLVNFGIWLGPIVAAFLMSIWVGILARFDLKADHAGGILLYILGLVLTFNLGRDITLLTVYPLIFGYLIVRMVTPSTERTLQNECTGQSLPSR
jgi:O-antigen ligase